MAATRQQTAEHTEITTNTQELLGKARELRPQEVTGQYRAARRQLRQAQLAGEGEARKAEKVMAIDLEYCRKCLINEPLPAFAQVQAGLEQEVAENEAVLERLHQLSARLGALEEDIG